METIFLLNITESCKTNKKWKCAQNNARHLIIISVCIRNIYPFVWKTHNNKQGQPSGWFSNTTCQVAMWPKERQACKQLITKSEKTGNQQRIRTSPLTVILMRQRKTLKVQSARTISSSKPLFRWFQHWTLSSIHRFRPAKNRNRSR
jgi:hypothetical protein